MKKKTHIIFYDKKGQVINETPIPKFMIPAWEYYWATRLYSQRKKMNKEIDHWDWKIINSDEEQKK